MMSGCQVEVAAMTSESSSNVIADIVIPKNAGANGTGSGTEAAAIR